MADRNYLSGDYGLEPEENKSIGTAADFAKTLGSGALSVGSNIAAGARYAAENSGGDNQDMADLAHGIQLMFQGGSEAIDKTVNPKTLELASAGFTSEEFWQHPVLGLALKGTAMLPSVVATAVPGMALARTLGATRAVAAAGGALNASDGVDQFYQTLEAMSDEDLQKQSPKYRVMREDMDEEQARARFNREAQGWGPALNLVFGAVAGAAGPAGIAARGATGGAKGAVLGATEAGALKSAGIAGAEGALSNAAQEGALDLTVQNAELEGDLRREIDYARAGNAALEGGVMGGLIGGAAGGVSGFAAGRKAKPIKAGTEQADAIATTDTPDPQLKTGSTGQAAKPADIEANPQNSPSTTPSDKGKASIKTREPTKPQDQTITVDPALALAVKANEGEPVSAQPTELAAMTERSPNETLDKLDQEGKPPVPAEVTPAAPVAEAAPLDTGMNVPEAPASIVEQVKQIGTGGRKAVMVPKNGVISKAQLTEVKSNPNYKILQTPRGRFIYDNRLTGPAEIKKLSAAGRENELLGLGPVSKPEAVADAAAGAQPVAITERTPAGVEVKAAAGTDATLPEQVASLEAQATPGNVVAVETPEAVVEKRNAAGGRILDANTENVVNPKFEDNEARAVAADEVRLARIRKAEAEERGDAPSGPGTNYRGQRGRDRDAAIAAANEAVTRNPPDEVKEKGAQALPVPRRALIERARKMVEHYEKKIGKAVQSQIKKSKKGDAASDSAEILTLRLAKDLVTQADRNSPQIGEIATNFKADEFMISKGFKDEVIARRLEEGNRNKQQGGGDENAGRVKADETDLDEQGNVVKKGLDEDEDLLAPNTDEKTDDEAPSLATGEVSSVDADTAVTTEGNLSEHEASEGEIKQGPSVAHIKEVVNEKVKSTLSPREARKAAMLGRAPVKNNATPVRLPTKADERAAANVYAAKKGMRAEALRVERNPTPEQVKAGNYKKGHRVVEGLPFTIENPKGATRRGYDENGNATWSVKMPADYGYFRGTKGADGEHIDGYDLRTGRRNFVVDQIDTRTGDFDEHKVFVRAKDEAHVVETYRAAFSDGRGDERLGNVHELTREELHEWLDKPQTESITKEMLDRDMGNVNFDVPEGPTRAPESAMEALQRIDLSDLEGADKHIAPFFKRALIRAAGNVQVVTITPKEMADTGNKGASGLHVRDPETKKSIIYISDDASKRGMGLEYGGYGHTLMHEVSHAATVRAIETVPGMRNNILKLARMAEEHINDPMNRWQLEQEFGTDLGLKAGDTALDYPFSKPRDELFVAKEFIAEVWGNKHMREVLSRIKIDANTAEYYGLRKGFAATAWDALRSMVRRALKLPANSETLLDAVMKVNEKLIGIHEESLRLSGEPVTRSYAHDKVQGEALRIVDDTVNAVRDFVARPENNTAERSAKILKWRTLENIGQLGRTFFDNNVTSRISNVIEKRRVRAERLAEAANPNIQEHARLRAANPEKYAELSTLRYGATMANVHADVPLSDTKNAHLAGNKTVGKYVWQKAQHAELKKIYDALPEEFKALYHADGKYFRDQQEMMAKGIQNNQILKLFGVKDEALAERVRQGTLTDADRAALGSNAEVIEQAGKLSKIEGYYVPLIRHGDHVVQAETKVTRPGNAKEVRDGAGEVIPNEFEFTTAKEATDYAKASPLEADIEKVWLDPKTGERLGADELDAVDRYRVSIQNRHVEFVEGRGAAEARAAELAKDGSLTVHEVVPRKFEPNARQGAEISTALGRLIKKLERSDAYEAASPTERAAMRRAIEEAALASHGSTRISSKALPRRNVAGHSENAIKDMHTYAQSASRYIAGLEHNAELEAAIKDMNEQVDNKDHSKQGSYARTQIANEINARVSGDNGYQQGGPAAPWIKRLMSASFTDKLGSPAYSIINAMQTAMLTTPYYAAKYGVGRTFAAMGKAYADVQAHTIAKEGAAGTVRQFAKRGGAGDFISLIKQNLNAEEKAMIDAHVEVGTISQSAGMEVGDIVKDFTGVGGKVDAALGYLEGIVREMPKAVETVNRSTTALAGYRMARAAGETHEQAIQSSIDAVNNTQFNYSPTNAPPLFNHPLLKVALQFKKYGQGVYQLIGTQIGRAMRNERPGDRAEAVKTLIYVAGTHMAMAGALGLPTEPFKYLVMAAGAAGLPVGTWSDVEDKIRKVAAETLGATGGEALTRGLPRLLGLDLSRMGLDSVTSFGEPRGKKESDVKSWLFDSVSGPVVSLGADWVKGIQSFSNGDISKGFEQTVPLKAFSDSLRAYRQATEGKKTAAGVDKSAPYSPSEAGLRALGFGNAREAEEGAKSSKFYRESGRAKEERNGLVNKWVNASPSDKTKAWANIVKFNQKAAPEQKISPKELTDKSKRDAKNAKDMVLGIRPNKKDKRFLDEGAYYNTR